MVMRKKHFHQDDLRVGKHFCFKHIYTDSGAREVLARKSEEYFACKVLPLLISPKQAKELLEPKQRHCSLQKFCEIITRNKLKNQLKVPVLSVDRPVGYFVQNYFRSTNVYELPGGVVSNGERVRRGGLREMMEELRVEKEQIYAYATLLKPCPFDSGSHVELMGIIVALVIGKVKPIMGEGIQAGKTRYVNFEDIPAFCKKVFKKKKMIEGYVPAACSLLDQYL